MSFLQWIYMKASGNLLKVITYDDVTKHAEIAKVERKVLAKLIHAHANQRFKLHTERRNSTATVARLNFRIWNCNLLLKSLESVLNMKFFGITQMWKVKVVPEIELKSSWSEWNLFYQFLINFEREFLVFGDFLTKISHVELKCSRRNGYRWLSRNHFLQPDFDQHVAQLVNKFSKILIKRKHATTGYQLKQI